MAAEGYVDIYKTNSQGDVIRRESVSLKVWNLWRSKKENGDTRKGWTLDNGTAPRTAKAPTGPGVPPAKIPLEIKEAADKAAGVKPSPAGTVPPAPPASDKPSNDLTQVTGISAKIAEALNKKGISTFAELSGAPVGLINAALDGMTPPMTPKKAQVPAWQAKAKELSA